MKEDYEKLKQIIVWLENGVSCRFFHHYKVECYGPTSK